MSMGRALRRTLSPQTHESHSGGNSMHSSGASVMNGKGGGCVVFDKTYEHTSHSQHSHLSSLASLSGGIGNPSGFASASSPSPASYSDHLFSLGNLSLIFPVSLLRFMGRTGGSIERLPKSRGTFFRRPMMHLLLCLVLGIVMGFTPITWFDFSSRAQDDLASVNGFVTNLQREGSKIMTRGEKLIEVNPWSDNAADDATLSVEGLDNSRVLQSEHSESGVMELPPGLNYTLDPERKLLIIVTPTYNRAFQAHYLTRLAHTLRLVPPPLLWLVVEIPYQTLETAAILRQTGIMYRHLVCRNNMTDVKDRGLHQRNFALEHIEMHQLNGIVYFADDDNVYSQELFEQMRRIRRFGTWLVGMLAESKAKTILEGPVCEGDKVIGWHATERSKRFRRFYVDFSGFAFNSTILWDTANWRHRSNDPIRQLDTVKEGFQETTFVEQLVEDEDQMEGLPSGCRKIMVWHVHMEAPDLAYPYGWSLPKPLHPSIPLQTHL